MATLLPPKFVETIDPSSSHGEAVVADPEAPSAKYLPPITMSPET